MIHTINEAGVKTPSCEEKWLYGFSTGVPFPPCHNHQAGGKSHVDTHLLLKLAMIMSAVNEKDVQSLRISSVSRLNTTSFIGNSSRFLQGQLQEPSHDHKSW